jgi:hypothetical protein
MASPRRSRSVLTQRLGVYLEASADGRPYATLAPHIDLPAEELFQIEDELRVLEEPDTGIKRN